MRNLLLIHMESLNQLNYRMNREFFPNLQKWEQKSVSFSKYFSTSTSTYMTLSDLAFGGGLQNEPIKSLTSSLAKYCYPSSVFDELSEKGYQVKVLGYPLGGKDAQGMNENNFIGFHTRLKEMNSYEEYMESLDVALTAANPFAVWSCNYISNISLNHSMENAKAQSSLERWREGYRCLDRFVDDLMKLVEKKGLLDNTTVIFYGDHGDDLFTHGHHSGLVHAIEPYATLIHTPFWIYDSRLEAKKITDQLINTIDIRGIIEYLLEMPAGTCSKNELKLSERNYSMSRNAYAAQSVRAGSFNKGYSLTDGSFLLLVSNYGVELYQIDMDPVCQHNLLQYFDLEGEELRLNNEKYSGLKYHFPELVDKAAIIRIGNIFFTFREFLQEEVRKLYEYAECEERFLEVNFWKIHYKTEEAPVEAQKIGLIPKVINRLLNCMQIDEIAVYGGAREELKGVYTAIKQYEIDDLEKSKNYKVLYIEVENQEEFDNIIPWIEDNKSNSETIVHVKESGEVPYCFGKIFKVEKGIEVSEDFKVLAFVEVSAETNILETIVKDFLAQGIDVYLLDMGINNAAADIIRKLKDNYSDHVFIDNSVNGVGLTRRKEVMLEFVEGIARKCDYDWYIYCEANEIMAGPWKDKNLRETIYHADQLGFNIMENLNPVLRDYRRKIWKKDKSLNLERTTGEIAQIEKPKIYPLGIISEYYYEEGIFMASVRFEPGMRLEQWRDKIRNKYDISQFLGKGVNLDSVRSRFELDSYDFSGMKLILYGAGNYGQFCYAKLSEQAEIVAWVDGKNKYMPYIFCKDIASPDVIRDINFDAVYIAIVDEESQFAVKNKLLNMGVSPDKIWLPITNWQG